MDISSLFEEMIDFISFFLYKRKKAASSHHNFAHENNKEVWLRGKISFRGSTPRCSTKHSEVLQRLRERTVNPSSNDIAGSSPAFRTKQQPYGITAVQQVLALLAKVNMEFVAEWLGASLWHLFTQVRNLSNSLQWSVDYHLPPLRLGIA